MVTHLCRSTHICVGVGEVTITATPPGIRMMAMSWIVILVDLAIFIHLDYPSTQGDGLEG